MVNTVKFKYIFADDFNPDYVTGALGGVTPSGDLVINFYLERPPLPKVQVHELTDKDTLGKELEKVREPADTGESMVRYIRQGIVLNEENAVSIRDWLSSQITHLQNINKKRKELKGTEESTH